MAALDNGPVLEFPKRELAAVERVS